jgi:hypothetical protein
MQKAVSDIRKLTTGSSKTVEDVIFVFQVLTAQKECRKALRWLMKGVVVDSIQMVQKSHL